jgi:hypothetical protein
MRLLETALFCIRVYDAVQFAVDESHVIAVDVEARRRSIFESADHRPGTATAPAD